MPTSGAIFLKTEIIENIAKDFQLSWSHYVTLLTINSSEERKFYEIESIKNSWSVRELERQINSSLYERLVLGQVQMYVNYFDRFVKLDDENPTIGIVKSLKHKSKKLKENLRREVMSNKEKKNDIRIK